MCRVPSCLKNQGNDDDFILRFVSMGPFGVNYPCHREMAVHKYRMLSRILDRTGKDIGEFFDVVKKLEDHPFVCYEGLSLETVPDRDGFLLILVLDGCFILRVPCTSI